MTEEPEAIVFDTKPMEISYAQVPIPVAASPEPVENARHPLLPKTTAELLNDLNVAVSNFDVRALNGSTRLSLTETIRVMVIAATSETVFLDDEDIIIERDEAGLPNVIIKAIKLADIEAFFATV